MASDPHAGEALPSSHPLAAERGIWHPTADRVGPVWILFRRVLKIGAPVSGGRVCFSASQRARIWLDGQLLAEGPPRSDRETWPFMEVAVPDLPPGIHVVAVEVVHYGSEAGKGQIGGPGFLVMATDRMELKALSTGDPGWRCHRDPSRHPWKGEPLGAGSKMLKGHRAIGPGQELDGQFHPWGWREVAFDEGGWLAPRYLSETHNNPWGNRPLGCHLVRNRLPEMVRRTGEWQRLVDARERAVEIPLRLHPGQILRLIGDAGCVVTAFPELSWRGGRGSRITLTANEIPFNSGDGSLLHGDSLDHACFPGQQDRLHVPGEGNWSPDWIRAFRYLVVDIEAGPEALDLDHFGFVVSGYPMRHTVSIELQGPRDWDRLIRINRATMAACSHETFFDCPAWEQAQFPGDSRIMARHHYLACCDDRLPLKAIADCAASRTPSGLLRSHWPSRFEQVISTYSLQWIGMLHDHWWYMGREEAIRPHLPVARNVLQWFMDRRRDDGLLGFIEEAPFVDWAFPSGCPEQVDEGGSAPVTAMAAEACGMLAEMERVAGFPELSERWDGEREAFLSGLARCWDGQRQLLRDHPEGDFSIHTQVQAALAGYWNPAKAGEVLERALGDEGCRQAGTLYYRSHLAQALRKSGRRAHVYQLFEDWFRLMETGVTTWPESDREKPRSQCHGWGCMIETELLLSLFGLSPAEPGWKRIRFEPLSSLPFTGTIRAVLPSGNIRIHRERSGDPWDFDSDIPLA